MTVRLKTTQMVTLYLDDFLKIKASCLWSLETINPVHSDFNEIIPQTFIKFSTPKKSQP